jgi:hypothetical protein
MKKMYRVYCFCGLVRHELGSCTSRNKLVRMTHEGEYKNRPEMCNILEPIIREYVTYMVKAIRGGLSQAGSNRWGRVGPVAREI